MANNRDDFEKKIIDVLAKRASYVCSNPECKALTIAPSEIDSDKFIYVGVGSHITAAASGGPRYDASLTPEQRSSIENAIFLCVTCSVMIDKNNGLDFSTSTLKKWKGEHETWVRSHLNKSVTSMLYVIDGEHKATGVGNITGLEIKSPSIIKPGTKVTAEGIGNITGTKIGG
jgi:hypothetical protein